MPDDNPNNRCIWEWDGLDWQKLFDGCSIEERCEKPGFNGSAIFETAETFCEP